MRGGHRGAADRGVDVVDDRAELGAGGAGGGHVDAGSDDLRLEGAVPEARAAAGEAGHHVVDVDGTDGEGRVGRAGRRDRGRAVAAVVAGGDDEQAVRGRGQLVDGQGQRAGCRRRCRRRGSC